MVRRDIMPDIFMLAPAGTVKILDFGLARHGHAMDIACDSLVATEANSLTAAGAVVGTPDYVAREHIATS